MASTTTLFSHVGDKKSAAKRIDPAIRKANAAKLAAGYTKKKRFFEYCYLSLSTYLWCANLFICARYFISCEEVNFMQIASIPLFVLPAMALADLVSGFVHWTLDTWGSPETPVFGSFIRSFREHHADPSAMCSHDFIETNADTTLTLLPALLWQHFAMMKSGASGHHFPYNVHAGNIGMHVFLLTFFVLVAITNEIHKWSHMVRPHFFVRKLMNLGIILSPKTHHKHHVDPFDCSYCITTGWMNPPLDRVNFWRYMEILVTMATGAVARENDQLLLGK
ncbi:unnamed protein product [Phytomonas sp. EM1]|nr:unnamed protein product [Phytomonas sp. EM1]|eukprot:CCW63794.1 unnamed protein product [Phytomonas sp. isolate EM1]